MHLFEFNQPNLNDESRAKFKSLAAANLPKNEILVFDLSELNFIPNETLDFIESLVDQIKAKGENDFIVMARAQVLKSFSKTKTEANAKSLIQVKDNPAIPTGEIYSSLDERMLMTLQTSMSESIQELCFLDCLCEEVIPDEETLANFKYVAKVEFSLANSYTVLFSMTDKDLVSFASVVMQEVMTEVDEMMTDWPAEIANHTCNFMRIIWNGDLDKKTQTTIPERLSDEKFKEIRVNKSLVSAFFVENEKFGMIVEIRKA